MSNRETDTRTIERRPSAFSSYHPALVLGFFTVAIVFCMCLRHPAFLAATLICSLVFYLCVRGRSSLKALGGLAVVFAAVTFLNPLVNTQGVTVLFVCPWGWPYTLEALGYGAAIAAMFVAMLLWFGGYNHTMSSEEFTYLFGRLAPALSLVLTLVFRLVPTYQRKASELSFARTCVGKGPVGGVTSRVEQASTLLSALMSWAFEHGIVTADSMNSRGYGCGRRSTYASYRFSARDARLLCVLGVSCVFLLAGLFLGGLWVEYVPAFAMAPVTGWSAVAFAAYLVFLLIPSFLNVMESVKWRVLVSRT
ncbi:MAG: energy-coupling factor transporter transmembrane component T [Coriobacteriales bacterium]|jgi:energy-coupling factor transport system permease protein